MKRTLLVAALVLAISTSIIAGTMAMYVVEIDDLAEGSVVAKEFVLEEGTNNFEADVKIAPGETVDWEFSVKNYDGSVISETAMDLEFEVTLADAEDKTAIAPLVVTVKDEDEEIVGIETGTGAITFTDEFDKGEEGQDKTYTVSIHWPHTTSNVLDENGRNLDARYAGADYGTSIKVSVTGTQQE